MYRFDNKDKDEVKEYFFQREFLNEKYSKLSAIQGNCSLEISKNPDGKITWVWANAELEISDGTKTVSISLGVDEDYEESLKRLDTIIDITKALRKEFVDMKKEYDEIEKEAKYNRIEDKNE